MPPISLPNTMKAIEITQPGAADVLQLCQRPVPTLSANQVLIRVAAAGINRPDVFQRMGLYPAPKGAPDLPGLEVSGEIIACSEDSLWRVGDHVCALLSGGGYAEYAIADESLCLPVPDYVSLVDAASLPETFFTVWHNLVDHGKLKAGDTVLIQGGSSGIGCAAIQIAKALGAKVIATAGSDKKVQACINLGADIAINYKTDDFVEKVKAEGGCDIVLDMVGGEYVQQHIRCCKPKGRVINIAFLAGSKVEIDLMPVMLKQLVLTGSTLRSQPLENKAKIAAAVRMHLWPLLATGKIKPIIYQTLPLAKAAEGQRLMESSQHIGKILLLPDNN